MRYLAFFSAGGGGGEWEGGGGGMCMVASLEELPYSDGLFGLAPILAKTHTLL